MPAEQVAANNLNWLGVCRAPDIEVALGAMQASPYDLSESGYSPVPIETPTGRAEYVRRQIQLAERAAPLRTALMERCRSLLSHR